jgi:hypothetical protein
VKKLSVWNASEWNYRISSTRNILVKSKNVNQRKVFVEDVSTKRPFILDASENILIRTVDVGKEYLAAFKIYTAKSTEDVEIEFVEFFHALDVDRPAEDFLDVACNYPMLIKFELVEIES